MADPEPISTRRRRELQRFLAQLAPDGGIEAGDLAPVDEALTHTSAGLPRNHERLEFLGDAVLRLAAAEYLQRQHPQLSVGQHSALRSLLVSDAWLADLGERCGIEQVLRVGRRTSHDRSARRTLRAEATEALIGALYVSRGSLEPIHRWLTPHWQRSSAAILADRHGCNWKSALQEWSQGRGLGLPRYDCRDEGSGHADPQRFQCRVHLEGRELGQGRGGSRRAAEQDAARMALDRIDQTAEDGSSGAPQRSQ
ncbi:ribonuclease III [Synechococcus sp. RSCCF101]|uniref:ribonuclease III n=1 Tax=Synechococcus sp. RSCCF101 TaxID=2511069 RepID=UPI001248E0C4|nr:ribonuclease III [Synechococcus sp. RSCCF101]QEY32465.1 ribonuclease III [Synechococcus sp. RSCCF101]